SRMYVVCLERAARNAGVTIELSTEIEDLITGDDGEILGAIVSTRNNRRRILAEQAVILSTGDFSGNQEMRRTYLSDAAGDSIAANPNSTGKGHLLGSALGAELKLMDVSTGPNLRFKTRQGQGLLAKLPLWPSLMKPLAAIVQIMPGIVLRPFVK